MLRIDHSQLSTYITCPRQYRNRFILKLKKSRYDERNVDLDFGGAVHNALELLYKGKSIKEAQQAFREQFTGLVEHKVKTPANGEKLIEMYYNYWQQPTSDLSDKNLEILAVEPVLDFPITDDITWLVKPDTVVKNNAGIWSLEHKTTTDIPYNFFFKFDPNMQISGQCEGIRLKYGQCSGVIINAMAMGYRENKYKGKPAGFWFEPARDIINRNTEQLNDFRNNVIAWVKRLNQSIADNEFPKNEGACHNFKGCTFRELCVNCDDEQIKETLYELHNPLEYLEDKNALPVD